VFHQPFLFLELWNSVKQTKSSQSSYAIKQRNDGTKIRESDRIQNRAGVQNSHYHIVLKNQDYFI
jgi:hypothetical protein